MAYTKKLELMCVSCKRHRATDEVIDRFNESYGKFCAKCAAARVKELTEAEKEYDSAKQRRYASAG